MSVLDQHWLFLEEKERGPFTLGQLQQMWASGIITRETLYWQPGFDAWEPLSSMIDVFEASNQVKAVNADKQLATRSLPKTSRSRIRIFATIVLGGAIVVMVIVVMVIVVAVCVWHNSANVDENAEGLQSSSASNLSVEASPAGPIPSKEVVHAPDVSNATSALRKPVAANDLLLPSNTLLVQGATATSTSSSDPKAVYPQVRPSLEADFNPKALYAHARPSVVLIVTSDEDGKDLKQGSGFAVGDGTQIVTNYHVVEGASAARMKTADGIERQVPFILGLDKAHDLAILASPVTLPALKLPHEKPEVGDSLIAIGNPEGLEASLSVGVLSGIRETVDTTYYQLTAPISPGSSGGPILNATGEVIAVATLTFKDGQNLNFGIPTMIARPLLEKHTQVSFSVIAPQKTATGDSEDAVTDMTDLYKRGLYAAALQRGMMALKTNGTSDPLKMMVVGIIAVDADEYATAIVLLEGALASNPKEEYKSVCWTGLFYAYTLQGRYPKALHAYNMMSADDRAGGHGLYELNLLQVLSGDTDEVLNSTKEILQLPGGREWLRRSEQTGAETERFLKEMVRDDIRLQKERRPR